MFFKQLTAHKLTYQQAATLLHVCIATINVWKQKNEAPKWAELLLERKLRSVIEFPNFLNPTDCLKRIRNHRKLKHKQLADIIGVETRLIADWLHKKSVPPWAAESLMLAILFDEDVIYQLYLHERKRPR